MQQAPPTQVKVLNKDVIISSKLSKEERTTGTDQYDHLCNIYWDLYKTCNEDLNIKQEDFVIMNIIDPLVEGEKSKFYRKVNGSYVLVPLGTIEDKKKFARSVRQKIRDIINKNEYK